MKPRRNNRGFTLIELLVVLAVIAILGVAFGATWLSNRPHYRLTAAARDLVSDIRFIRANAVKEGVTATIATIDFTSNKGYTVLDADGNTVATRDYTAKEYQGVEFSGGTPSDLYACSDGRLDTTAPSSSDGCGTMATVPIVLTQTELTPAETRTVCVFSTGAVSCWTGTIDQNQCDDPSTIPAEIVRC